MSVLVEGAVLHDEGLKYWAVELTDEAEREPDPDRRGELDQTLIALWDDSHKPAAANGSRI